MRVVAHAILLAAMTAGPALAEGDVAKGEKAFKKCAACHMVGPDAKVKVGPMLNGIFGKVAGSQAEYAGKYSKGLVAAGAGGTIWNVETLAGYVENPKSVASDSKMAFAGIKKPEEREDLIAYLLTFSPDYKPAN